MADRFATSFEISGVLPGTAELQLLINAIESEEVGPDWGEAFADYSKVEQHLLAAIFAGASCFVYDDQRAGGEMPILAEACRELGLPYKIHVEGRYEFDGTIAIWKPGWREEKQIEALEGDQPAIALGNLRKAQDDGKTLADVIGQLEVFEQALGPLSVQGHKVVGESELTLVEA